MDRSDRVFCWVMTVFAVAASFLMIVRIARNLWDVLMILCACYALVTWTWKETPRATRRAKMGALLCGDIHQIRTVYGTGDYVCGLEPDHACPHKSFHSSGFVVEWDHTGHRIGGN
jgi:hypothetical protein